MQNTLGERTAAAVYIEKKKRGHGLCFFASFSSFLPSRDGSANCSRGNQRRRTSTNLDLDLT